jgi:hypothetical protein
MLLSYFVKTWYFGIFQPVKSVFFFVGFIVILWSIEAELFLEPLVVKALD